MELAVLLIGALLAAAISGSAGFGGALLLLPLLTAYVGPRDAVPLLTIAQLIGNLSRAGFGARAIRWRPVVLFLAGAVPGSVAGALSFVRLPAGLVTRGIGVAALGFALLKYADVLDFRPSPRLLVVGGAATGLLSGLVGSAGPLGAAVFLSLGLPPVGYVASEATTALAMHAVKSVIYGVALNLDASFWLLGVALGAAMVVGTWISVRCIRKMSRKGFERYVLIVLAAVSIHLIVTA